MVKCFTYTSFKAVERLPFLCLYTMMRVCLKSIRPKRSDFRGVIANFAKKLMFNFITVTCLPDSNIC